MASPDLLDKATIRRDILTARRQFPAREREKASRQIQLHLLEWPFFQNAQVVHIFVNQSYEVETTAIIHVCWKMEKTVVVPYLVPQSNILGHSILSEFEQLQTKKFDLREPRPETRQSVDLKTIDLVIVPGVAFDKIGRRLGYGKGYYDRFLSQINGFFLGLTFQFQIVPMLPQSPHDISMDSILTESGFIFNAEN